MTVRIPKHESEPKPQCDKLLEGTPFPRITRAIASLVILKSLARGPQTQIAAADGCFSRLRRLPNSASQPGSIAQDAITNDHACGRIEGPPRWQLLADVSHLHPPLPTPAPISSGATITSPSGWSILLGSAAHSIQIISTQTYCTRNDALQMMNNVPPTTKEVSATQRP
ncbi:hypothetical protein BD311DRAFT_437844 [Dichomitus squalens]|uniref:Uncharacterized protein n=1 Tax=Dichomitus squalens TaxID=114155 RepID=A0A4Q9MZB2_9APHY|nr:hypothetical protein BD311DRAFT_437844 [Dichomitus squalens]